MMSLNNMQRIERIRRRFAQQHRLQTRIFRDRNNPLDYMSDAELIQEYRFHREAIIHILDSIAGSMRPAKGKDPLTICMQLLIALQFYATGGFFHTIAEQFQVTTATVCKVVHSVTRAIYANMAEEIVFPSLPARLDDIKEGFRRIGGISSVIGCLDCTHVKVMPPIDDEPVFVNRKNFHSINVQAVADYNYNFINMVATWPGSVHDSRIFQSSRLFHHLNSSPYFGYLLGDGGYGLKTFCLTPYSNPVSSSELRFNNRHSLTRVKVEQTFGIWKSRFRCLSAGLRFKNVTDSAHVIVVTAILHNVARRWNLPDCDTLNPQVLAMGNASVTAPQSAKLQRQQLMQARNLRDRIASQL